MKRQQITALVILVAVLYVGYLISRQSREQPFQAEEQRALGPQTQTISGVVTKVGEDSFEMRQTVDRDPQPVFTILVPTETTIVMIAPEERAASFADITPGDEVIVTPFADREDQIREAELIDLINND